MADATEPITGQKRERPAVTEEDAKELVEATTNFKKGKHDLESTMDRLSLKPDVNLINYDEASLWLRAQLLYNLAHELGNENDQFDDLMKACEQVYRALISNHALKYEQIPNHNSPALTCPKCQRIMHPLKLIQEDIPQGPLPSPHYVQNHKCAKCKTYRHVHQVAPGISGIVRPFHSNDNGDTCFLCGSEAWSDLYNPKELRLAFEYDRKDQGLPEDDSEDPPLRIPLGRPVEDEETSGSSSSSSGDESTDGSDDEEEEDEDDGASRNQITQEEHRQFVQELIRVVKDVNTSMAMHAVPKNE